MGGDGEASPEGVLIMSKEIHVFQSALPVVEQTTFTVADVRLIELRAFMAGCLMGRRAAVAVLCPLLEAANEALVRKPIMLDGVPGTGWHNADDARTFLSWFERSARDVYTQGYEAGARDGARAATRVSLALLSLKGCRTAGDLLRTALPSWVLQ